LLPAAAFESKGAIEQVGTPDENYDHPVSPFVYGFIGHLV
jgi:sulfate transport system ATP-binding protein